MKKRQFVAGLCSALLLGAVSLPVYAEDIPVEYQQASTWTVTIPKTTLSQTEEVEQSVVATAVNIRPDQTLQVKINGLTDGKVVLTRDDNDATTTSLVSKTAGGKSPITSDTVIAEFENQSTAYANGTTGKLYFSPVPADTKAGDYNGTMTYVMEAVDK